MKFNKVVNDNVENKNGFLVACVCSIVLLLTLCYFGVNSKFKGTSAAGDSVCLGGANTVINSYGKTWCCPEGTDRVENIQGTYICVDDALTASKVYVGTDKESQDLACELVKKACDFVKENCAMDMHKDCAAKRIECAKRNETCTPSDDYVCSLRYGDDWRSLPDDKDGDGHDDWDACTIDDYNAGWDDIKNCKNCYSPNHIAQTAINSNLSDYCFLNNETGVYYYGKFSEFGNMDDLELYSHISENDGKYQDCLKFNKYEIKKFLYNGSKDQTKWYYFYEEIVLSVPEKTVKFKIDNSVDAIVNGEIDKEEIKMTFEGWIFQYNEELSKYAQYYSSDSKWVDFTKNTGTVNAEKMRMLYERDENKYAVIRASWVPKTVTLPTITKDGYICNWIVADGISRADGTTFEGGANFTITTKANTNITLTSNCVEDNTVFSIDFGELENDGDYIIVDYGMTVQTLKDNIKVKSNNYSISFPDIVNTGAKVKVLKSDGTTYKEYTVVVLGDANGDGAVNTQDYVLIYNHLSRNSTVNLQNEYLMAADYDSSETVTTQDYIAIYNYLKR